MSSFENFVGSVLLISRDEPREVVEARKVMRFETLEELARTFGLPVDVLAQTIEETIAPSGVRY